MRLMKLWQHSCMRACKTFDAFISMYACMNVSAMTAFVYVSNLAYVSTLTVVCSLTAPRELQRLRTHLVSKTAQLVAGSCSIHIHTDRERQTERERESVCVCVCLCVCE